MMIKILGCEVNIEEGNSVDITFMREFCGFDIFINCVKVRSCTRWKPKEFCPLFGNQKGD